MNTPHDAVHTLTPLATGRLVAGREIAERLRSRLIWIMTALTTLLVVALIVIPALVRQPAKPTVVGLVGPSAQALGPSLHGTARAAKVDIRVEDVANSAVARSELKKGSLDVALSVDAHAAVAEVRGSAPASACSWMRKRTSPWWRRPAMAARRSRRGHRLARR